MLLLLGWVGLLAVTPAPASEPAALANAKAALQRAAYGEAFRILRQEVLRQAGDPEFDFIYGRCAYETGDYEAAVLAFERVLIIRPHSDRTRFELGRSYFALGELATAREHFQQVLHHRPPDRVQRSIHRYLEMMNQAGSPHRLNGLLALAVSFDDNVYAMPDSARIMTSRGILTLDGVGAKPRSDLISQNTLLFNHSYQPHPREASWTSSLLLYNASYAEEPDLNLNLLGLASGPVWQKQRWRASLQGKIDGLWLDGERYLTLVAVKGENSWLLSPGHRLGVSGQVGHLNYARAGRDAAQYQIELSSTTDWQKGRLQLRCGLELLNAEADEYAYFRTMLAARYLYPLPWQWQAGGGVRWVSTDYDGPSLLFDAERQDWLRELSLELNRPLWQSNQGSGRLQAQLKGIYSSASSKLDLYEYDKRVLRFTLSYLF